MDFFFEKTKTSLNSVINLTDLFHYNQSCIANDIAKPV